MKRAVVTWLKISQKKKLVIVGLILLAAGITGWRILSSAKKSVSYETTKATRGSLVSSISSTGTISAGNNTSVTTKVSGMVARVFVTNGNTVVKGQQIAEITLDDYALERQASAWVNYLEATEAVSSAVAGKVSADIEMWKARQAVLDAVQAVDDKKTDNTNPATHKAYTDGEKMIIDKTVDQTKKLFTVAESKYMHADADIANARAKVSAALRDYQENSAIVVAPATGTISDLTLAPGILVNANSTTSSTTGTTIVSSQTIGKISNSTSQLIASVNVSEVDVTKVKANQKATLTLDAFPDKTFTGKVLAVDTSGNTNSGVTSYPVTILLDPVSVDIYPKMGVSANIITNLKTDVIFLPATALTVGSDGNTTVQIMKDGKPTAVQVQTGIANDTDTEIVSGVAEGDTVVTSVIDNSIKPASRNTGSPFSTINRSSGIRSVNTGFGGGPSGF